MADLIDAEMPGSEEVRSPGLLGWIGGLGSRLRRGRSWSIGTGSTRVDLEEATTRLAALGQDGRLARDLATAAENVATNLVSLSHLTSSLAIDYLDRLGRPIPALRPAVGVDIVTIAYSAHLVVEEEPGRFGARDVPVLGTLPPLRKGRPPSDLLTRVVKACRRDFPAVRAVSGPVWDGFVVLVTERVHRDTADEDSLLAVEVVDGLARLGWMLRQVDIHYKQSPQRRDV